MSTVEIAIVVVAVLDGLAFVAIAFVEAAGAAQVLDHRSSGRRQVAHPAGRAAPYGRVVHRVRRQIRHREARAAREMTRTVLDYETHLAIPRHGSPTRRERPPEMPRTLR